LDISKEKITGALNLTGFANLQRLDCYDNQLTELNLKNCVRLTEIFCNKNQLNSLILPQRNRISALWCESNQLTSLDKINLNPQTLIKLRIGNNKFNEQDLTVFSQFFNLE